ncbi:MAG: DUF58 domain-containing protein [Cellulomonadaceae bacterium]
MSRTRSRRAERAGRGTPRALRAAGASLRRALAALRRPLAALGRPLSRVAEHASPLGWLLVAVSLLALLVGRRYGWDELIVAGTGLGAVLVLAALMTIGRSTYTVTVDLADHRVIVGQRALGKIAVRNVGRGRLLPAQIILPVGAGSANFDLPSMAAGAVHEEVFAVPTARRAVVVVGPVRSVRGDALGLVRREVTWTEPTELYIHPRTVSLAGVRAGLMRDLEGAATRVISENDMSFHALREYVPGDDRRNIHWRTSARIGTLMVRQYEDTRRTHTALGISLDPADYASEDEFELAVTIYASIGVQLIRDEMEVTAVAGPQTLATQTPPRLLDGCSGLELLAPDPDTDRQMLAQRVARAVPNASMALMITGSTTPVEELRESAVHIPSGVRTVFVSCAPGAELALRTHVLLSTCTLGDAADLPRLLSRLVYG